MSFESEYQERVAGTVATLAGLAEQASKAKETGKDAARMVAAFDQVIGLFSLTPDEEQSTVKEQLGLIRNQLAEQSGIDRTQGDAIAAQVGAMLQAGIDLADEIMASAQAAVAAWQASKPSGSRGGGSRASAGQGQGNHVELRCSCGWVGHDSTNANSARWGYMLHLEKNGQSHSDITRKPAKGEPDWQAITDAIEPVAKATEGTATATLSNGVVLTVTQA